MRAAIEVARATPDPVNRERISQAQGIPIHFLETIMLELKRAELVQAIRGQDGGFRLARPADEITIADIVRAVTGPLATVRGVRPSDVDYEGSAEPLQQVWIALRVNVRAVLENVTLADLASGKLPSSIRALARPRSAWA